MSKISEQKALEAYPEVKYKTLGMLEGEGLIEVDLNIQKRNGYIKGYDQALQDFMEKAEKILIERMYFSDDEAKELVEDFVGHFKNYMQK